MSTYESFSHAKWDGKYPSVFVPKGRTKALHGKVRKFLGRVFHALAAQRRSAMLAGHRVQEHVRMLSRIPPPYAVAEVVGSIKGQAAMAGARQCGGRQRHCIGETFGASGYAVSTVGCEEDPIRRYIRTQEQLDAQGRDEDGDF
jgi:putative transposase